MAIENDHNCECSACAERYAEIKRLRAMLQEAYLQIDYLHRKFPPTGTSETTLARIRAALDGR